MNAINNDFRRDDLVKELTKFGEAYAAGQNSRPAAAVSLVRAAYDGYVGPGDAKALWDDFQKGAAKRKGIEYKQENSHKVQVSKAKTFLIMGSLPIDGPGVLQRAMDIITELSNSETNPLKGSAYDNMVTIARRQKDLYQSGDERELTDDEIRDALIPDVKMKEELTELGKQLKAAQKLYDGTEETPPMPSPQLKAVIEAYENRIAEINAANEQKEAEATLEGMDEQVLAAYLAKKGMVATKAITYQPE